MGGFCQSDGRTRSVYEEVQQVDAATAQLQHPLDQLVDLLSTQHHVGQLLPTRAGHELP